jgi:monofunctional glycosyltransferase
LIKKNRSPKKQPIIGATIKKYLRNIAFYFLISSVFICLLLRWMPPPTSAFMVYRHFQDLLEVQTYQSINYRWISSKQISPNAYVAVVAAEDQQFFNHFGFDLHSIHSSIGAYLNGGKLRGASTISQQVAKNLFLSPSKNFLRKGLEVWFTLLIEVFWSKNRILTVYLNIAEFGDHLYGIEAASRHYFGVSAKKISGSQAALLASTLPNPIKFNAARPTSYMIRRQHWILRQMRNLDIQSYSGRK